MTDKIEPVATELFRCPVCSYHAPFRDNVQAHIDRLHAVCEVRDCGKKPTVATLCWDPPDYTKQRKRVCYACLTLAESDLGLRVASERAELVAGCTIKYDRNREGTDEPRES